MTSKKERKDKKLEVKKETLYEEFCRVLWKIDGKIVALFENRQPLFFNEKSNKWEYYHEGR